MKIKPQLIIDHLVKSSWTSMMSYCKQQLSRFSIFLPRQFHSHTSFPDYQQYLWSTCSFSLSTALQHFIDSDTPSHGQKIHSHIIKSGYKPNTNIGIKLLILQLKRGCLSSARKVFDELPMPTLSAYNYMIGGYLKQGYAEKSLQMVRAMVCSGERPDGFTLSMVLKASNCISNVTLPRSAERAVHAMVVKLGVESDEVLYTALIDSYVKRGKVDYARTVFDSMLEKNVACSTSMISGYVSKGLIQEAEDVFKKTEDKDLVVFNAMIEGYSKSIETAKKSLDIFIEIQRFEFCPNISTFASVIGACSALTGVEIGQQVHAQLFKTEYFSDIKIGSAVLDMYAKCGRVEDAQRIFDHMPEKNVFSWTSMIDGHGRNGNPDKALDLFHLMQESTVKPNDVTLLSALSACAQAGLLDRGREIFDSMETIYLMKPKMEHYACMVNLLGRAGSLDQAWEFVMSMPEKPNSDVWAALLSSCRLHGDVEMANLAAEELFNLNAKNRPGAYVALSDTLAAAGKWESVSDLREMMKVRGVKKDSAWSWVH